MHVNWTILNTNKHTWSSLIFLAGPWGLGVQGLLVPFELTLRDRLLEGETPSEEFLEQVTFVARAVSSFNFSDEVSGTGK